MNNDGPEKGGSTVPPDYVGILLNANTHRGAGSGKTGQEALSLYETAAPSYDLKPVYLRLDDIDPDSGTCLVYVQNKNRFTKTRIETPRVIHNRAIYKGPSALRKLERLQKQGIVIYNFNNRYGKDIIYSLLAEHPRLSQSQPASFPASRANIERMTTGYGDLILKPASGSVGRGIMRLRQDKEGWRLLHKPLKAKSRWRTVRLGRRPALPGWAMRRIAETPYLVQERLPLLEIEGRPLDVRVTVQRGLTGNWGITGMYAKISAPGHFLSNLAQGGSAFPAEHIIPGILPPAASSHVLEDCYNLALTTARYLSGRLPLLADLGMDIGITADGRCFLIECNGRDQRYGFRKAGMDEVWYDTYRKPMAFARHLLQTSGA